MEKPVLTAEEIENLQLQGYEDPPFFLRTFLKEWFPKPIPWVHRGIIAIVLRRTDFLPKYGELDKIVSNFTYKEDPSDPESPDLPIFRLEDDGSVTMVVSQFTVLMLPRGFSKTTLMNGLIIYQFCYLIREFLVYLSETATHSETQLGNVKREFESNDLIRLVFGNKVPGRGDREKWSQDQIETLDGINAIARGRGGQVRGANIAAKRPDLIILDDVEDEESVQTKEQIDKTRKWFFQAVRPALSRMNKDAAIICCGTLLHQDALLNRLAHDPAWTTIKFGALDKQGQELWPDNMPLRDLEKIKASFSLVDDLAGFYREYFNVLRSDDTAKFKSQYLRVGGIDLSKVVGWSLAVDPAISQSKDADFFSLAVVAMTQGGYFGVLNSVSKRGLLPNEQVDEVFKALRKWWGVFGVAPKVGIESVAYQAALIHLVRERMFRERMYFEITSITHSQKKQARVEGILQPRYAAGYVTHCGVFPELVEQLQDWPNGKLDAPDALAMAVQLLDPYAPAAGMDGLGPAPDEDQMEPLDQEDFHHAP